MVQWVVGSILHGGPIYICLVIVKGFVLSLSILFFFVSQPIVNFLLLGLEARCSSVVRAFAHGAVAQQIDPSWWTH